MHKQKVTKLGSLKLPFSQDQIVTQMGSIIGQKIDYKDVGVLRSQRNIAMQRKLSYLIERASELAQQR